MIPTRETLPVICTDDKGEVVLWVGLEESMKGVDGVGRDGEVAFKVGHFYAVKPFDCQRCHVEAMFVFGNVG